MAVAFVQKALGSGTNAATINGVTAGNVLLVGTGSTVITDAVSSVTDGSNTYTKTTNSPQSISAVGIVYVYYSINVGTGGNLTVTANWSGTSTNHYIWVREFSGFGAGAFHSDIVGTGSGTTVNTPSVSNTAGDLLYAISFESASISATGSPWAATDSNVQNGNCDEYLLSSSGSAQAVNWATSSGTWASLAASFTPAAGGSITMLALVP